MFRSLVFSPLALACAALAAAPAHAFYDDLGFAEDSALTVPVHLDLNGFASYSPVSIPGASSNPTLLQAGGGGTLAMRIAGVALLGVSSDYRHMSQSSDVETSVGLFTGSRFNPVSPTLGIRYQGYLVKLDYQFLGDYALSGSTPSGATVRYTDPSGFRGAILSEVASKLYFGGFFETVKFAKYSVSDGSTFAGHNDLSIWQAGFTAALVF